MFAYLIHYNNSIKLILLILIHINIRKITSFINIHFDNNMK